MKFKCSRHFQKINALAFFFFFEVETVETQELHLQSRLLERTKKRNLDSVIFQFIFQLLHKQHR